MFKNNMKFNRAARWINSKIKQQTAALHSWYSYGVIIVGHYYGGIIEGLYCCGNPLLEVT